jgi:hypothetical protein
MSGETWFVLAGIDDPAAAPDRVEVQLCPDCGALVVAALAGGRWVSGVAGPS